MKKVLLAVSELIFQTRLSEQLKTLGYEVLPGDSGEALCKGFGVGPDLLVVDLQSRDGDPLRLIGQARDAGIPVLAYGQHTKANVLRQAREAGAALAVPRSQLVEELGQLVRGLIGFEAPV
ncbi:MAG: hypothetical protein WEB00_11045 [Dehalococcoidia bacterium]